MPRHHINAYRYAVKFWPLHVSNGTDRAKWSKTAHCKQLLGVPTKAMRGWASSFAEYYQPKITLDERNFIENRQATVLQGVAGGLAAVAALLIGHRDIH